MPVKTPGGIAVEAAIRLNIATAGKLLRSCKGRTLETKSRWLADAISCLVAADRLIDALERASV